MDPKVGCFFGDRCKLHSKVCDTTPEGRFIRGEDGYDHKCPMRLQIEWQLRAMHFLSRSGIPERVLNQQLGDPWQDAVVELFSNHTSRYLSLQAAQQDIPYGDVLINRYFRYLEIISTSTSTVPSTSTSTSTSTESTTFIPFRRNGLAERSISALEKQAKLSVRQGSDEFSVSVALGWVIRGCICGSPGRWVSTPTLLNSYDLWKHTPESMLGEPRMVIDQYDAGFAPEFVIKALCDGVLHRHMLGLPTVLLLDAPASMVAPRYPCESAAFSKARELGGTDLGMLFVREFVVGKDSPSDEH